MVLGVLLTPTYERARALRFLALSHLPNLRSVPVSAASAWPVRFGASLVHGDRPSVDLGEVQLLDGTRGLAAVGHVHEGEAAGPARLTILDDIHLGHGAEPAEQRTSNPGATRAPTTLENTPRIADLERTDMHKYGTVGVVALDRRGNIAAGTSTGGTTAKRWNRVGDSPIIGAGTYASNQSCAVSATGTGEYFIRLTVARTICALVQYKGVSLQEAADQVVQKDLSAIHGDGGVVALTPDGQLAWSFNTPGMFRAKLKEGGAPQISVYRDEP